MISAWRPSHPPRQLRTEIAEAVSDQLAQAAATAWAERARRSLRLLPAMSTWQRLATGLVIAALLFLGTAIAYRIAVQYAHSRHPAAITPPSATASSAESAISP
jgi:type VI protein secretion system component VasF